jgi:hypothetical protein
MHLQIVSEEFFNHEWGGSRTLVEALHISTTTMVKESF